MFYSVAIFFLFLALGYLYLTPTKKTQTESPQSPTLQTAVKEPLPSPIEVPLKTPEPVPEPVPKVNILPKLTPTAQILKPRGATYQVKKVSAASTASANKENFSSLGSFLLEETQKCLETLKTTEKSSSLPKNLNPLADSFIPS